MNLDLTRVSSDLHASRKPPGELVYRLPVVLVIAHRGAPRQARENTVESFRAAIEAGAGAIELDVRRTADDALVVHHDPVLADGRPLVACRRDELPAHIPTMAVALDACAGTIVDVEIKNLPGEVDFDPTDAIADAAVALLGARHEPREAWLISSFRRETIDRCHALDSSIATAWLTIGAVTADEVAWAVDAGHRAIHPWDPTVDKATIDRCHEAGLHVNTWTCNDVGRAVELASWGIDGICTDIPDVIVAALTG
jgi:glycerophosphoryl diester phosphodiesterase